MRKICLKIHRWLGLALGVFMAIICFSGAAIVFQDEMKEMMPRDEVAEQQAIERGEFYRQPDPAFMWQRNCIATCLMFPKSRMKACPSGVLSWGQLPSA